MAVMVLKPKPRVYKAGCLLMCKLLRRLTPERVEGLVMQASEKPVQKQKSMQYRLPSHGQISVLS
jgi:hypothetical protein